MRRILFCFALTLLLTACPAPSSIVAPVAAPRPSTLATDTPAPTPTPILVYLRLVVTDQETGQPVVASLWVDGKAYGPAAALDVVVPFTGEFIIKAQAAGYKEWNVTVRGRFVRDKDLQVPVRLIPTGRAL